MAVADDLDSDRQASGQVSCQFHFGEVASA